MTGESANNYCVPNIIYPTNDIIFHPLAYPLDSPQKIVPPVIDTGDEADDIAYTDPQTTDILSIHISDSDDIFTIQSNTDTLPISTESLRTFPAPVCLTDRCIPICSDTQLPLPTNSSNPIFMNLDGKKKYKPVARKIKLVIGELPDKFRIIRNIIGDPLKTLPTLPTQPPSFLPTGRYMQEHKDLFDKLNPGFLLPAERDLMHYFMMVHKDGFAWE